MRLPKVTGELRAAFTDVPYPGDDHIASHPCDECQEVIERFRGKDWKDYSEKPLELVRNDEWCLSLMDPEAFHYFLPLFFLAALLDYNGAGNITEVLPWKFVPEDDPKLAAYQSARLDRLNIRQRLAIAEALRYLHDTHPDDYDSDSIKAALKTLAGKKP